MLRPPSPTHSKLVQRSRAKLVKLAAVGLVVVLCCTLAAVSALIGTRIVGSMLRP